MQQLPTCADLKLNNAPGPDEPSIWSGYPGSRGSSLRLLRETVSLQMLFSVHPWRTGIALLPLAVFLAPRYFTWVVLDRAFRQSGR